MFLTAVSPAVGDLCQVASGCCGADTTNGEFNVCFRESGGSIDSLTGMMGGDAFGGGVNGDVTTSLPGMDFSAFGQDSTMDVTGNLFG